MSRIFTRRLVVPLVLLFIIGMLWVFVSTYRQPIEQASGQETLVWGQKNFMPGSKAALHVVVQERTEKKPLPNAQVSVSWRTAENTGTHQLFTGTTNDQGAANVSFIVPAKTPQNQFLIVETTSQLGDARIEQPITIQQHQRMLITTDKPLYQPGQTIHMRFLLLNTYDQRPVSNQAVNVVISDSKNNKVLSQFLTTSAYGVAAADFVLADEVNMGTYRIEATSPETTAEKRVSVQEYVLPIFNVHLSTERPYYLPGEEVRGTVQAEYFFGKKVLQGSVDVQGWIFDVERNAILTLQGTTDDNGTFSFAFRLPSYLTGSYLTKSRGIFELQASVTDPTGRRESSMLSLPVTTDRMVIDAIPESKEFKPGVENLLYVMTSYPDGTPAETDVTIYAGGQKMTQQTGPYGMIAIPITPDVAWQNVSIRARDSSGAVAIRDFAFPMATYQQSLLVRPDHPLYRVGDTMNLTILSSAMTGTVHLDIQRGGQLVSTDVVSVSNYLGQTAITLTPDLMGLLQINATMMLNRERYSYWNSYSINNVRLVVVDPAKELDLAMTTDRDVYRPGEQATMHVQITNRDGKAIPSALGMAIVDESVFALKEEQSGFANTYFLLQQELLQPKQRATENTFQNLMQRTAMNEPQRRQAQEIAAFATLAPLIPDSVSFSLSKSSLSNNSSQPQLLNMITIGVSLLAIILPLVILMLNILALKRECRDQQKSIFIPLGMLIWFFILIVAIVVGSISSDVGGIVALAILLVVLISFGALGVHAWRKDDPTLQWTVGLGSVYIATFFFLIYSSSKSSLSPPGIVTFLVVIAISLFLCAVLLHSITLSLQGYHKATLAGFIMVSGLVTIFLMMITIGGGWYMLGGVRRNEVFDTISQGLTALPSSAPMAKEAMSREEAARPQAEQQAESPLLRQYFPETMFWLADGVTNEQGHLQLTIPIADTITTWRVSTLASSQEGHLSNATTTLRVFQDFFIEPSLPAALTVGDELSLPVAMYNYLPNEQTIHLHMEQADWFESLDASDKELTIGANGVSITSFRIRSRLFGTHAIKFTAIGKTMSDAIQKEVEVLPNGKRFTLSHARRLTPQAQVTQPVIFPTESISGTQTLMVKIYPGIISQVMEGVEKMLHMPHGCFEQTMSATYVNVLTLDYLQAMNKAAPEIQRKAEDYIRAGYQRLLTFEVSGGGFSLYGKSPADVRLTAYGLQGFNDIRKVFPIDEQLMQRTAEWLLKQQQQDGSWFPDKWWYGSLSPDQEQAFRLQTTAYVVWSLLEAGQGQDQRVELGLNYVRQHEGETNDAYTLSLIANALVTRDQVPQGQRQKAEHPTPGSELFTPSAKTVQVLQRLVGMAKHDRDGAFWSNSSDTLMGGYRTTGSIETTALVVRALIRADMQAELVNAALTGLVQRKDHEGIWYSTSATIAVLRALYESVLHGEPNGEGVVTVTVNDEQPKTLTVLPENFDVVQLLTFDHIRQDQPNEVLINFEGKGRLMYHISGSYYLPWDKVPPSDKQNQSPFTINLVYQQTQLKATESVTVVAAVQLNDPQQVQTALIDLGLPPGFEAKREDFDALVDAASGQHARIDRYEFTGQRILLYMSQIQQDQPLRFSYHIRPRFSMVAQIPASLVYDYYNPDVFGEAKPSQIEVSD